MHRAARAREMVARTTLLALLALLASACAGPVAPRTPSCWPHFPYRQGWLGADGAFSIPLSASRSLWLFGDTFVGEPGQADRSNAAFVHNSIGISECRADAHFDVEYFWGTAPDGTPRAFLERDGGGWWWIFGGFLHEGRLYLALLEVESTAPHGPFALPFRLAGTALARVDDPAADPRSWRPVVMPLSHGATALPFSNVLTLGDHLYLFAFLDTGGGHFPRILLRLPLSRLAEDAAPLEQSLETLGASGAWLPGLAPERARILMDDDATEMSVLFHAELGKWIALYNFPDPKGAFPDRPASDAVYARSADRLEGPWSERRLVFRIPELARESDPPPDPNTACYAAKEQPGFSLPGSLTFTYVCNLLTGPGQDPLGILARLTRRMDLYRPVAAAVSLPFGPPAAAAPRAP
jgi:hypothetical protein